MKYKAGMPLMALLFLAGCSEQPSNRIPIAPTPGEITELCVGGVTYIYFRQFQSGYMSVKLGQDSKVVPCYDSVVSANN